MFYKPSSRKVRMNWSMTGPRPASQRHTFISPSVLGWAISVLVHIGLAGGFLLITFSAPAEESDWSGAAASIQPKPPPLQTDPIITDLQIEPFITDPLIVEPPTLPEVQGANPLDTIQSDAIAIYHPSESGALAGAAPSAASLYRSDFFGVAGRARGVCYVVDCSASMIIAFEYIQRELKHTVEALTPAQYFHIILYAAGEPVELSPPRLTRANAPRRKAALVFIDQMKLATVADTQQGSDAVVNAMRHAFEVTSGDGRPAELIYLLTDGQFDHQKVDELVRQKQADRTAPARINIIACGNRSNEEFLQKMATACQGQYRFVSDAELAKIRK